MDGLSRALIGIAAHTPPAGTSSRADDAARLLWEPAPAAPALGSGPATWMT